MTGHDARVRTSVAIPIRDGRARFVTFDGLANQDEHFALCFGDLADLGLNRVDFRRRRFDRPQER